MVGTLPRLTCCRSDLSSCCARAGENDGGHGLPCFQLCQPCLSVVPALCPLCCANPHAQTTVGRCPWSLSPSEACTGLRHTAMHPWLPAGHPPPWWQRSSSQERRLLHRRRACAHLLSVNAVGAQPPSLSSQVVSSRQKWFEVSLEGGPLLAGDRCFSQHQPTRLACVRRTQEAPQALECAQALDA